MVLDDGRPGRNRQHDLNGKKACSEAKHAHDARELPAVGTLLPRVSSAN